MNSKILLLLPVCLAAIAARAEVPAAQRAEVDYLLEKISTTPCALERNGQRGTNAQAVEHIRRKADYFKDRIRRTEDFIDLAASRSEATGRPYRLVCPGKPALSSHDWLYGELASWRKLHPAR